VSWTKRKGERSIELGSVERGVDVLKLKLGLWLRGAAWWGGEGEGWKVDGKEGVEAWDGADGRWCERCPRADLSDVPPEVFGGRVAEVDVELTHQGWSGVGRCKVCH